MPVGVEGGEAHAVGVRGLSGSGYIWSRWKSEVFGFGEGNRLAVEQVEGSGVADGGEFGFDDGGIDGVGGFADEAEEDGAVGSVSDGR